MGYGQGPGQAYNWGHNFEIGSWAPPFTGGFEDGTSFGLTVAAMGFIASSIGGIIYLNRMRKKGLLADRQEPVQQMVTPQQIQGDNEIPVSDSIDKLTVQLALVFLSYMLAYLTMRGLNCVIETGALGSFGTNTLQPLIWGFNFLFSTLFGILVKTVCRLLQKKGVIKQHFTNTFMQDRIAGFMFDVMVVASIAAINLSAFTHAQFVLPLVLMCIGGAVLTYLYLDFFCKRLFPNYRHEAFLSLYGMLTGTASTGVILLRECDPHFATPAANNLVYQQGYAILFGAPLMLLMGFGAQKPLNSWITLGVMAVMLVILNLIAFRKKKKPGK
jgi:ESS family glutamate:Na+ symporter